MAPRGAVHMDPMDHPTLRDFLTNHPLLDGQSTGTHHYIYFRHLFWEHLVNGPERWPKT